MTWKVCCGSQAGRNWKNCRKSKLICSAFCVRSTTPIHCRRSARRMGVPRQRLNHHLRQLEKAGLLDETLVVLATPLGRTPILQNGTRSDYPGAFSCVLAGGGIRGGQLHGSTSDNGWKVIDPISPQQLNSTIAWALGIDYREVHYSPSRRPFTMGGKSSAEPVTSLFKGG